jgi:hypothetical protein
VCIECVVFRAPIFLASREGPLTGCWPSAHTAGWQQPGLAMRQDASGALYCGARL